MSGRSARLLRLVATLAVLIAAGLYAYARRDELSVVLEVGVADLLLLVAVLLGFFVTTGITFYLLVSLVSVRLSVMEWLALTFLPSALNYLSPMHPGAIVRAVYLKRKQVPYSRFAAILAANLLLLLLSSGLMGFVVIVLMWLRLGVVSGALTLLCAGITVAGLLPMVVPLPASGRHGRIWVFFDNAVRGFAELRRQRRRTAAVGLTLMLQHGMGALSCLVAFRALGFEIEPLTALALGVFAVISNLVSITPNNIGVQEVVIAYVYTVTGMDFESGLIGAGLLRAVHAALCFLLAPPAALVLMRKEHLSLETLTSDRVPREDEQRAGA